MKHITYNFFISENTLHPEHWMDDMKRIFERIADEISEKQMEKLIRHFNLIVPCKTIEQFIGDKSFDQQYNEFFTKSQSWQWISVPSMAILFVFVSFFVIAAIAITAACSVCCTRKSAAMAVQQRSTADKMSKTAPADATDVAVSTEDNDNEPTETNKIEYGENSV